MQFGISECIEHWGKYRPNNTAIFSNDEVVSYQKLDRLINGLCSQLVGIDISSNRIAIAVRPKLELLVSIIATLRIGKSPVILNTGLHPNAILHNIKNTDAEIFLYDSRNKALSNYISSMLPSILRVEASRSHYEKHPGVEQFSLFSRTKSRPEDEWGIIFSSGSTGIPKGIERNHGSIVTELIGWCLELNLNKNTSFYIGRPLYYTGGLVLSFSTLVTCGLVIANDYSENNSCFEVWHDYQEMAQLFSQPLNWAFFIPDQLREFVFFTKQSSSKFLGATSILCMGAPISGIDKKAVVKHLGSQIIESWGNSESLGTITDPEDVELRPESIGRPFLTDKMSIVDDNGIALPPYEQGKIAGSEDAGFVKYSNMPEESQRVKRHGLIISDDIGYVDSNGFFYICGRFQNCVIQEGKTIFLENLESFIQKETEIDDCCAIARKCDNDPYEIIIVASCSNTTFNTNNLKRVINGLSNVPCKISDIILVESIPRLPSGKIDRLAISQIVQA